MKEKEEIEKFIESNPKREDFKKEYKLMKKKNYY
jgi:ssDNA-specific exonuclease RecJ